MADEQVKTRKKLIEVALPLDAINVASAREKSIRHGHPSTLHLWWARRPLAAARAVIFSQMVDDPSSYVDELLQDAKLKRRAEKELEKRRARWDEARALHQKAKAADADAPEPGPEPTLDGVIAELERDRLFRIVEDLVLWENTTNEKVLNAAREEVWRSWRRTCLDNVDHPRAAELFNRKRLPAFHDPFAGGGALPLEAQRLGLEAYASDLNPVAVLINKAMIEIPPRFAGRPPINPATREDPELFDREWKGAEGLADDVRFYGQWMRDEAEKRIGHLYPKVEITVEMVKERPDLKPYKGKQLTVIAWLWARTVKSPNPAFADVEVPLVSTWMLSTKSGKEAYVEPVVANGGYRFAVKVGKPRGAESAKLGSKRGRGAFECLVSGVPIPGDYIKREGNAGRMGSQLMAIVAEGDRGRVYLAPTPEHEAAAHKAKPEWKPVGEIAKRMTGGNCTPYGLTTWGDLFTPRQLVALNTYSDLVGKARERIRQDAITAGLPDDGKPLREGGTGALAYAEAVGVYLTFALSRSADRGSTICSWDSSPKMQALRNTFGRQAIPMVWDFAEGNSFSESSGNWMNNVEWGAKVVDLLPASHSSAAFQSDATSQAVSLEKVVSTDPPYYDNIGYADLSDFFYVWLRRTLQPIWPELFATVAVPKIEELVATPYRHGSKERAEEFFLDGMTAAMHRLAELPHPAFPVTIYYAYKQSETEDEDGASSTGWETFLDAVIRAGFSVGGTWPIRTELSNRMIGSGTNALASSIVLVCRPRPVDAPVATRREFRSALQAELTNALTVLQRGNLAPVDLAQAALGPGMAVFTQYSRVLEADGSPMEVGGAFRMINEALGEALASQEGDFDPDTRWAITWFEQYGHDVNTYDEGLKLARAKNTSVEGLGEAGIVKQGGGKVRLLRPEELPDGWDPSEDQRLGAWEMVHHLIRVLASGGEQDAAALIRELGPKAEAARELAYRLYVICERKKRAQEAMAYNGLVQAWPELQRLATVMPAAEAQGELLG